MSTDPLPIWKRVFNTNQAEWGHISVAIDVARRAGYPLILWNGKVYAISADPKEMRLGHHIFLERNLT